LIVQAVANRWLTGESAASGAIVKLSLYNPYMTAKDKLDEYWFLLKYVVFRNTEHHFADTVPYGYIVPAFAAVPLVFRKTRPAAIALWGSILSWLAVVAMNAQVRWQNERYTMPAVAWLLLLASLGLALVLEPPAMGAPWSLALTRIEEGPVLRRARGRRTGSGRRFRHSPGTADARSNLVLRTREPQHPRPAHHRRKGATADDACAEASSGR